MRPQNAETSRIDISPFPSEALDDRELRTCKNVESDNTQSTTTPLAVSFVENVPAAEVTCQFITDEESTSASFTCKATRNNIDDTVNEGKNDNHDTHDNNEVHVGDHVYQWRRLLGIPCVFQHHGIVMDVIRDPNTGKTIKLTIADFSNVESKKPKKHKSFTATKTDESTNNKSKQSMESIKNSLEEDSAETQASVLPNKLESHTATTTTSSNTKSKRRLSLAQEGIVRAYTDTDKWHKVTYEASWWKRQVYRSGTATKAKSDPVGMVLARVNFILQHPELLPDYHVVYANCECVAFWCKTGSWSTLQASRFLELTAAGQVKSSATLAAAAAGTTSTVTVPASGIWGWLGYTSTAQVSWLSLHPMAIPGLACYAVVTVGLPAAIYVTAHNQWKKTTRQLCDAFWESATEHPDVFAECITHWSDKGA